jgi:hypothetical protein
VGAEDSVSVMLTGIWIVRKPDVAAAAVVFVVGSKSAEMLKLRNVRGEMRMDGLKVWFIRLTR